MKSRILTGLFASLMAVLLPLPLLGMTPENAASPAEVPVSEAPSPEATPRSIQEIIIHENQSPSIDQQLLLSVLIDGEETEMTLKEYLVGVLMGEMPASFEMEALKAQAVAARTYTLRRLEQGGTLSNDPSVCQAFGDISSAQEKWGEDWETFTERLYGAVEKTDGQVLTYNGALISATYFSCSGGKTESAQAVWGSEIPYLVSVDSPGEEDASGYESTVTVDMSEFLAALDISNPSVSAVTYTPGGGVDTLTMDGRDFAGTEMRSLFGLRSTMFSMSIEADTVTFYVQGYGHRVGLSQYGAQAMARQGSSYEDILKWYYTGVTLENYGDLVL